MRLVRSLIYRWNTFKIYAQYRAFNQDYADYYAKLMDQRVKSGWGVSDDRSYQLKFLKEHGLKTNLKLLDFGCGPLSAGLEIIDYLEPGNYTGVDISSKCIEEGKTKIKNMGLADKQPHIYLSKPQDPFTDKSVEFDYVWAQSVFTHMPPEDIASTLVKLHKSMKKTAVILADFNVDTKTLAWSSGGYRNNNFSYELDTIKRLGVNAGFKVTFLNSWAHPTAPLRGEDVMVEFTRVE